MSLITRTMLYEAFIKQARDLLDGSDVVHPEYIRGMVELTARLNGLDSDAKEQIESDILNESGVVAMVWTPEPGMRVRTVDTVYARDVGRESMTTVYGGCEGYVRGFVAEWHDVHFEVGRPGEKPTNIHVWIDPLNLRPIP